MPQPASSRHQRRSKIARARAASSARGQRSAEPPSLGTDRRARRQRIRPIGVVVVLAAIGVGAWLVVGQPNTLGLFVPGVPATPAVSTGAADVTPVALPTFGGADALLANPDDPTSAPEIGTPTPGVAGPTAVVVTNSPWQVLVAHGVVSDLNAPTGVAVDGEGNLFVVDFDGNFVQKFSPGGQPLIRFGQKGTGAGQFAGPLGVAVDAQGNIYVADTNNQRIQKLSPTGQPLASWGSGGDDAGQFWLPSSVAVDDQGKVYVADRGNHRVQVLSATGQPLAQWGSRGPAPGQFWSPSDVGVDSRGQVYVADSSNQRIQVLSGTGQPLAQWGWEGLDPGQFELPSSVAVEPSGNVIVSDTRNNRVQRLSANGQPLAVWGTATGANTPGPVPQRSEPGTFYGPGGVAVDARGAIYVADTRNQRIQKLSP